MDRSSAELGDCGNEASERPHACDQCDKRFKKKSNLKAHTRIHTGETPYHCPMCRRPFKWLSSLNTHAVRCTGDPDAPSPPQPARADTSAAYPLSPLVLDLSTIDQPGSGAMDWSPRFGPGSACVVGVEVKTGPVVSPASEIGGSSSSSNTSASVYAPGEVAPVVLWTPNERMATPTTAETRKATDFFDRQGLYSTGSRGE